MYIEMSRMLEQVPPVVQLTRYYMLFVVTHGGTGGDIMHFILDSSFTIWTFDCCLPMF